MGLGPEIEIENTLRDALKAVLGALPTSATPVEALSAYVFSLVKDLGLSESRHVDPADHERPTLSEPLRAFVGVYLPLDDDDALRDALYAVFVVLSDAPGVGKTLNGNRPLGWREVLLLAQTAWNLERSDGRSKLPLGRTLRGDIVDPKTGEDFATMMWTLRSNLRGVPGRSSGDSFRKQAARLAVLAAVHLIKSGAGSGAGLDDAQLEVSDGGQRTIVWPKFSEESSGPENATLLGVRSAAAGSPVLVGSFAEIGGLYETRGFDVEIERLWADGGSRRIWLRGGPGLGKSYAARRVMQESLAGPGSTRDELLIWVDSADSVSVTRELARGAERLPGFEFTVEPDAANRDDRLARSLLEHLRTAETRWLIVLDDARADELIQQRLLPPGTNPHGRVLITTLGDSDADSAGRQVLVEQFTPAEADRYLSARLPNGSATDRARLALVVDHHPLMLSVATATITAERMTVDEWLSEFAAVQLDVAADHPDAGGYSHPVTATWRVALAKAARGMAEGVVERAAMVAAIQDPAGHPSWLWQKDAVRDWVDASTGHPRRNGRIHPAVRRLIDFGILHLLGNWSDGRIAIHQMAARAVRESADPALLADLAGILAREWVLQLTANPTQAQPEDVAGGAGPLSSLLGLDSLTQDAVAALLGFSRSAMSAELLRWAREYLAELEPLLLRAGVVGRIDLAERHTSIGQGERAFGRHTEAQARFETAYEIYEQVIEDANLTDDELAELLESMAELNQTSGRPELAQKQRIRAVKLRERLADTSAPNPDLSLSNLIALTNLHQGLADNQRSLAVLDRAIAVQATRPSTSSDSSASEHAQLARQLASHGRIAEAIDHMREAARLHKQSGWGRLVKLRGIRGELGMLYARQGEWQKAERWLKRGEAEPLLLASVQLHKGDHAAAGSLAKAAALYRASTSSESEEESASGLVRPHRADLLEISLGILAQKASEKKRWDDAADIATLSLDRVRVRAEYTPGEAPARLADAYTTAGACSHMAGRYEIAVEFLTSSITIFEMLSQMDPEDATARRKLGHAHSYLAQAHLRRGAPDAAVNAAGRAVSILEQLAHLDSKESLDFALQSLALAYASSGDNESALSVYARRVNTIRAAMDSSARDPGDAASLADALGSVISTCVATERWSEALEPATELVALRQALADADYDSTERQAELAMAFFALGVIHDHLDGLVESEALARKTVTIRRSLLELDPTVTERQAELAYALAAHADSLSKLGREPESEAALTDAVNHLQLPAELNPGAHVATQIQLLRALSGALFEQGRGTEADATAARADDLERRFPDQESG